MSSEQLLFWRTSLSEQPLLCSSFFFQNGYFFRAKLLPSSRFLGIGSSLGKLLFGPATFLVEEMFRMKISTEELLFRNRYFCTASMFSEQLLCGKGKFLEKQYSFHVAYFFGRATFLERLLFKRTCQLIIKWARYQLHTVKVWEIFLLYTLLLKVAS